MMRQQEIDKVENAFEVKARTWSVGSELFFI